jgi:outer membrane protein TolC
VEKAAFQAKGSWQASLPALSLDFSWSNDQAAGFGGTYSNTPPNPRYWLGLSLALPSGFNGLSQAGRVSEARANLRSARAALREAEKSVTGEVASARIELERALSALGTARRKAEIAAESLSLVTQHYRQGSADVIRLGQAQLDNLDALTQRAQALHDAVLSRARYAYATGGPL